MRTSDRDKQALEIFTDALGGDPEERRRFVDEACAEDGQLRTEVEQLLTAHDEAEKVGFLDGQLDINVKALMHDPLIGTSVGQFKIERQIGEGGMGRVYEAQQNNPARKVALKLMRLGLASPSVLRRFQHEVKVLARLQHPGIAQIYDAGTTVVGGEGTSADHQPYFAMEFIGGQQLCTYADELELGTRQRMELLARVCEAVEYAHGRGVIHRDLKPANILVDQHGQPKILDFGVSRVINEDVQTVTLQTGIGQLVGTIPYMSPEQVTGNPSLINQRSDVYSLGVILFELLAARLPYDLSDRSIPEAVRAVREEDPSRLSSISPAFRGDIETIVGKALEKDPDRRYQSAGYLASDIHRYLRDEPIVARPVSTLYQLRKFARRNKALVSGVIATFIALTFGLVGTTWFAMGEAEQRQLADVAKEQAEAERDRAREAEQRARRQAYLGQITAARAALDGNEIATVHRALEAAPPEFRNWEWHYLNAATHQSLATLTGHREEVWCVTFSPDGTRLASSSGLDRNSGDNSVRLWDVTTGKELAILPHDDCVYWVAFSPDGNRLASASLDRNVRVWDAVNGELLLLLSGHERGVLTVAFSPDGAHLASGSYYGSVRVWDPNTGEQLRAYEENGTVYAVAFSPNGAHLAWGASLGIMRVWDFMSAEEPMTLTGHERCVRSVAFSPDGARLASGSFDSTARIWDPATGEQLALLRGHQGVVQTVTFSPDGRHVASGADDNTIRIWDTSSYEELVVLRGHEGYVRCVAYSPDGTHLASASADNSVRIWDGSMPDRRGQIWRYEQRVNSVPFHPAGESLALGLRDGTTRICDFPGGKERLILQGREGRGSALYAAAFSPDGAMLATGSWDGAVNVWDALTGSRVLVLQGHKEQAHFVAFSPDGSRLASTSTDRTVRIWDTADGEALMTLRVPGGGGRSAAFSPDGVRLASGALDGTVYIWRPSSMMEPSILRGHEGTVNWVTFSPDGARLASGSTDGTARIWDLANNQRVIVCRGHEGDVCSVSFSPDGMRLASASWDKTVRVWDARDGNLLGILRGHQERLMHASFSPDGSRIVSGSDDGTVRIWDTVPYRVRFLERRAVLATREGRHRQAEAAYRKAYRGCIDALAEDHPGTLGPLRGLIASLVDQKGSAEAEPLAVKYYDRNEAVYGPDHVMTINAIKLLVGLYERWDKPSQAAEWQTRLRSARPAHAVTNEVPPDGG